MQCTPCSLCDLQPPSPSVSSVRILPLSRAARSARVAEDSETAERPPHKHIHHLLVIYSGLIIGGVAGRRHVPLAVVRKASTSRGLSCHNARRHPCGAHALDMQDASHLPLDSQERRIETSKVPDQGRTTAARVRCAMRSGWRWQIVVNYSPAPYLDSLAPWRWSPRAGKGPADPFHH